MSTINTTRASSAQCLADPDAACADTLPARQPRVALFSGNYNCVTDGANLALNRLVSRALGRGLAMRIYSPTVAEPAFAACGELVAVPSIPMLGWPGYRFAPCLPAVIAADVRYFAPDVIHVSAPDGLGAGAIRLARRLGVPVVASVHTRFETYLEFYGFELLSGAAEFWLRRFYRRCDMLLVPTLALGGDMRASGIGTPMRVWGRGVEWHQFAPSRRDMAWRRARGIRDGEIALLFFGRIAVEKGLETYISVVSDLLAAGLRVRSLIVGDGPARHYLAARLPDAILTGHLSGTALGRAVASADILINPSVTEGFANATLEAMASGVAVVAADTHPNRVLIDDPSVGRIVGPQPRAYVDAVRELAASPVVRTAMAQRACARARRFEWPTALDTVLDAYRDLAEQTRGAPELGIGRAADGRAVDVARKSGVAWICSAGAGNNCGR